MAFRLSQMGSRFLVPISFSYYEDYVSKHGRFLRDLLHFYSRLLYCQVFYYSHK